ncbi:MAG: hypothetical protein A3F67_08910 [Verrucomicrobia bacterium RIFCSPHIGHO2_12_FULL_41_10]|nr:MAG: hypothetical protein A3F67_08910 [Verrucomicrobia bacterium RIFCSPHIGHO2_12_FULL_41_10]HLB33408.1 hypothetical protein [Chthoniobacterales bacterium]
MSVRTATVRDLRNHYTTLLSWLKAGEEIFITQRGKTIARLVPETNPPQQKKVDWTKSAAFLRDRTGEKMLTAEEIASVLDENKGHW